MAFYYFTVLTFIIAVAWQDWVSWYGLLTALIEYLTALLEYLDHFAV